jgi:hypothetical protein
VHANKSSLAATATYSCTGALRRNLPTGHRSRPVRRGTSPRQALTKDIGAQELRGYSHRIGSVPEDSAVRAVARGVTFLRTVRKTYRSFAADAHYCIMVRVFGPAEYKDATRFFRARHAGSRASRMIGVYIDVTERRQAEDHKITY